MKFLIFAFIFLTHLYSQFTFAELVWAVDEDKIQTTENLQHPVKIWDQTWDFEGREGCFENPEVLRAYHMPESLREKSLNIDERIHNLRGRDLNVYLPDNRTLVEGYSYPSRVTGRFGDNDSYCTAALIAPNLILTNGHCVTANLENEPRALPDAESIKTFKFYPAIRDNAASDRADVVAIVASSTYLDESEYSPEDWALVLIDQPLGLKYGWVGIESTEARTALLSDLNPVSMTSHSFDRCYATPCFETNCELRGIVSGANAGDFTHDCSTMGGSSGSSMLNSNNKVVALNHAHRICEDCEPAFSSNNANLAVETQQFFSVLLDNAEAYSSTTANPELDFDQVCVDENPNTGSNSGSGSGSQTGSDTGSGSDSKSDTGSDFDDNNNNNDIASGSTTNLLSKALLITTLAVTKLLY